MQSNAKLKTYYFTAVLSLLFAVLGFSYNAWRLEVTEDNSNIRTASFEVMTALAELEQVVFAAHFDQDQAVGNPRTGWVKIGLITDLSALISPEVQIKADSLKQVWSNNWEAMPKNRQATEAITNAITSVRSQIKLTLMQLN